MSHGTADLHLGDWKLRTALGLLHVAAVPSGPADLRRHLGGSDELTALAFDSVERAFDRHIQPWKDRVTKKKMTSLRYLADLGSSEKFDLIYVDGSHHGDDVILDVVLCFEHLKVGGVMILDDYLWRYYPRSAEEPARAINSFLRLCEGRHKLLMAYRQVAIVKTAERST